ncbi:MAG: hypothetical protein NVS4B3_23980 [Gemmatimonadaceae bacterium]
MFIAIYRWRLKRGREHEFEQAWARMTTLIRQECGSGGSALFRSDDGTYVAIARWPDRESRDRCVAADEAALTSMRDCIEYRLEEERLTAVNVLWSPLP